MGQYFACTSAKLIHVSSEVYTWKVSPNRRNVLLGPLCPTRQTFRYNDALSTGPSVDESAISILATSDAITTSPMDLPAILNVVLGKAKYSGSTLLDRNWPSARSRCFITQIDWPCKWCDESVQSRKPPLANHRNIEIPMRRIGADRFVLLTRKVPIVIRYSCSIHPSFHKIIREREYLQKDFFLIYRHFENFIWLLKILLEIFLRDNCKSWKYLYSGWG